MMNTVNSIRANAQASAYYSSIAIFIPMYTEPRRLAFNCSSASASGLARFPPNNDYYPKFNHAIHRGKTEKTDRNGSNLRQLRAARRGRHSIITGIASSHEGVESDSLEESWPVDTAPNIVAYMNCVPLTASLMNTRRSEEKRGRESVLSINSHSFNSRRAERPCAGWGSSVILRVIW